jgi:prepilin-type N-terminal cleavage/methylation domain-containing protein
MNSGFTLVEMAIVLFIVALLLGGLMPTIASQVEQRQTNETRKQLDEIKEALIGYAIAKGNFPCPAISASDGAENRNVSGACNQRQGYIPWSELGVAKLDAWGRIIRYSATPLYTNTNPLTKFKLGDARDITISTRNAADALVNLSNSIDIPVVILSHGKNGYGATLDNGTAVGDPSATNTDEKTNYAAAGTSFVSKDQSARTTGSGEFDDLVGWISANTLFGKMVAAGRLP